MTVPSKQALPIDMEIWKDRLLNDHPECSDVWFNELIGGMVGKTSGYPNGKLLGDVKQYAEHLVELYLSTFGL